MKHKILIIIFFAFQLYAHSQTNDQPAKVRFTNKESRNALMQAQQTIQYTNMVKRGLTELGHSSVGIFTSGMTIADSVKKYLYGYMEFKDSTNVYLLDAYKFKYDRQQKKIVKVENWLDSMRMKYNQ